MIVETKHPCGHDIGPCNRKAKEYCGQGIYRLIDGCLAEAERTDMKDEEFRCIGTPTSTCSAETGHLPEMCNYHAILTESIQGCPFCLNVGPMYGDKKHQASCLFVEAGETVEVDASLYHNVQKVDLEPSEEDMVEVEPIISSSGDSVQVSQTIGYPGVIEVAEKYEALAEKLNVGLEELRLKSPAQALVFNEEYLAKASDTIMAILETAEQQGYITDNWTIDPGYLNNEPIVFTNIRLAGEVHPFKLAINVEVPDEDE